MSGIGNVSFGRNYADFEPSGPEQAQAPARPASAQILDAIKHQGAPELTRTLAAAKKEDPVAYRTALRDFFKEAHPETSKLKLHNMALDRNNDGKLTFSESFKTMDEMGFNRFRNVLLSGLTALALAPQAAGKFTTVLDIDKADKTERSFFRTGFDNKEALEGRLDEIMSEDLDRDGFVTIKDLERMVDKRTSKMTGFGAKAINYLNKGEWQALTTLMEGNRISRDELRDFYQGSLFFSFLEPENLAKKLVEYRK